MAPHDCDNPHTLNVAATVRPQGDALFDETHARLAAGIVRFFMRRTAGRAELSEELAQKTWAGFWQSLSAGQYDESKSSPATYVYAIAYRTWLRFLDETSRHPSDSLDEAASTLIDHEDPASIALFCELLDRTRLCVATLRQSLNETDMHILNGIAAGDSERRLARTLRLAPSTVNKRKTSALARLRECLKKHGWREL